jgi:SAM-dependent methyltransferase
MSLNIIKVDQPNDGLKFKEHQLAHELLDNLRGVEFGPAYHNDFNLPGSIGIAPKEGFEFYRDSQVKLSGAYIQPDLWSDAENCPDIADSSIDYVITSHVFEHIPDPMKALREWNRMVRDGGIIFMIVPVPGALPGDAGRPLATEDDWLWASGGITPDSWDYEAKPVPGGRRGHYWVYTPDTLNALITKFMPGWGLAYREDIDQKVGNGFTLVYVVSKHADGISSRGRHR